MPPSPHPLMAQFWPAHRRCLPEPQQPGPANDKPRSPAPAEDPERGHEKTADQWLTPTMPCVAPHSLQMVMPGEAFPPYFASLPVPQADILRRTGDPPSLTVRQVAQQGKTHKAEDHQNVPGLKLCKRLLRGMLHLANSQVRYWYFAKYSVPYLAG